MYECFGSGKYKMSEEMWCGCYGLYVINTCEMFHVHVLAVMSPVQQTCSVLVQYIFMKLITNTLLASLLNT